MGHGAWYSAPNVGEERDFANGVNLTQMNLSGLQKKHGRQSNEDPMRVFIARGISQMGTRAQEFLSAHYSEWGRVLRVKVQRPQVKPGRLGGGDRTRMRRASLAFIAMDSAASVARILAAGPQQVVAGCRIRVERLKHMGRHPDVGSESATSSRPRQNRKSGKPSSSSNDSERARVVEKPGSSNDSEDSNRGPEPPANAATSAQAVASSWNGVVQDVAAPTFDQAVAPSLHRLVQDAAALAEVSVARVAALSAAWHPEEAAAAPAWHQFPSSTGRHSDVGSESATSSRQNRKSGKPSSSSNDSERAQVVEKPGSSNDSEDSNRGTELPANAATSVQAAASSWNRVVQDAAAPTGVVQDVAAPTFDEAAAPKLHQLVQEAAALAEGTAARVAALSAAWHPEEAAVSSNWHLSPQAAAAPAWHQFPSPAAAAAPGWHQFPPPAAAPGAGPSGVPNTTELLVSMCRVLQRIITQTSRCAIFAGRQCAESVILSRIAYQQLQVFLAYCQEGMDTMPQEYSKEMWQHMQEQVQTLQECYAQMTEKIQGSPQGEASEAYGGWGQGGVSAWSAPGPTATATASAAAVGSTSAAAAAEFGCAQGMAPKPSPRSHMAMASAAAAAANSPWPAMQGHQMQGAAEVAEQTAEKAAVRGATAGQTLSMVLMQLQDEDPRCMFITRQISRMGFRSQTLLRKHYSKYGQVNRVFAVNSKVKPFRNASSEPRVRSGSLGFVVMASPEVVDQILALGKEQTVAGFHIRVEPFEKTPKSHHSRTVASAETTSTSTGGTFGSGPEGSDKSDQSDKSSRGKGPQSSAEGSREKDINSAEGGSTDGQLAEAESSESGSVTERAPSA
uniref:RRM domain-containing protein n=1 Tax=Alexandrium monilatum TaxID=311494 RepID=A0A6T1A7T4_9DINO